MAALLDDMKVLRDTVRKQERRIKYLEDKIECFEREDDEEPEEINLDEEENNAELV